MPKNVKVVAGPTVFPGAIGIPILAQISKKLLSTIYKASVFVPLSKIVKNMNDNPFWHVSLTNPLERRAETFEHLTSAGTTH